MKEISDLSPQNTKIFRLRREKSGKNKNDEEIDQFYKEVHDSYKQKEAEISGSPNINQQIDFLNQAFRKVATDQISKTKSLKENTSKPKNWRSYWKTDKNSAIAKIGKP